MNLELLFGTASQKPIRVGVVGTGEFGATIVDQVMRMPRARLNLICDRDLDRAARAAQTAGIGEEDLRFCNGRADVVAAIEQDKVALVGDLAQISDVPLDALVEATGNPESATRVALIAIAGGMHSILATKETEVLVGPILRAKAERAGVVHTTIDGDQPATLISLLSRIDVMGLKVTAAGKSTARDLVWDPATGAVSVYGRSVEADDYGRWFTVGETDVAAAMRHRPLGGVPHTVAPDLCELTVVANHTGLKVDNPRMHAPIARVVELPHFFRPESEGGLLGATGVVDQFTCLRRPDELSFAGGVFAVVEAPTASTGKVLRDIGIPATPDGKYFLIHNPIHLLGVESPISIAAAALMGKPTSGTNVRQRYDMVGHATQSLRAGDTLSFGDEHNIEGLDHSMVEAVSYAPSNPIPYWLAGGRKLKADLQQGEVLRYEHVELPEDSALVQLRIEQDRSGLNGFE